MKKFRVETDSMGEVKVPKEKYWGAQTERSYENFNIGKQKMPMEIILAFAILKKASAKANAYLGDLDEKRSKIIEKVCDEIIERKLDTHFPLSVYQTGSGTHSNMNINEVIANRGNEIFGSKILHPNDHVNKSQSSNDTFPTAMHIAALCAIEDKLIPSIFKLKNAFMELEEKHCDVIKMGRTHLQDAVPITLGQEISGWRSMLDHDMAMIKETSHSLREIALGGTAVGTGLNASKEFGEVSAQEITKIIGKEFKSAKNKFYSLTSKGGVVTTHGAIKALSADLMKIANDIRWLSSGPKGGIGEIFIPENEPGSSIMPGKINPTQCEAMTMVCIQVMGNDTTISIGASQGNFQLNVFMPVIISNFLESVNLLAEACDSFRKNCVIGIRPNYRKISRNLEQTLMLTTVLNSYIGYENAAKIAKKAYLEEITLKEAALELKLLKAEEFDKIVDPKKMI